MQNDFSFLYEFEKSLHQHEVRTDVEKLKQLLSKDFFEFGSSGNIWSLEKIISRLTEENQNAPVESFNYSHKILSEKIILVTYETPITLRSSIWRDNNDVWQMEFHQGTVKKLT